KHLAILLKAKILSSKAQWDAALSLLTDSQEKETLLLKVEILWQKQSWEEVTEVLRKILQHPQFTAQEKPPYVVALAVALSHREDNNALQELRTSMKDLVAHTDYEAPFMLITSPLEKGETYYREA